MKNVYRPVVVFLTLLVTFGLVSPALAHPLGNFTINQYVGIDVREEFIVLDYVMDMAEIPAFQEITTFDTNANGVADPTEAEAYHAQKCTSLHPYLNLLLNNKVSTLSLSSSTVDFPSGVGGLPTLRLNCVFEAAIPPSEITHVAFGNTAFSDRVGWKEIVVISDHFSINGEVAATSISARLTRYPEDLLTSPLDQRGVEFEISSLARPKQSGSAATVVESSSPLADRNDAFTRLILIDELTLPALLLALAVSFVWGALHAMTPGHGKTIVGAYLVGSRGTIKHALYLGLTTTITHTLGVFVLGLLTLFAAQYIVPEQLYPWMTLLSGLFVVGIALNLLTNRFRSLGTSAFIKVFQRRPGVGVTRQHTLLLAPAHPERHTHEHKYVLNNSQEHHHNHPHSHGPRDHHHSDEDHHVHGHGDHSHLPPGTDGSPVTYRSLLALGISGGLLPCPSALVVLLGAIALNRIGFGLVLVLAFSVGLAGTLTAIGALFIYAGRLFERLPTKNRLIQILPFLSALFIVVIGIGITIKALAELGFV